MVDNSDKFFFNHFINTTPDDFDEDSEIMMVVVLLYHGSIDEYAIRGTLRWREEMGCVRRNITRTGNISYLGSDLTTVERFYSSYSYTLLATSTRLLCCGESCLKGYLRPAYKCAKS
jgi:hypothetical protein